MSQSGWRPWALGIASLVVVIAIPVLSPAGRQAQAHPSKEMRPAAAAASPGPVITPGEARAETDTLDLQLD